jgi:ATP-dependent helicase/nuclease subunit B
MLDRVLTDLEAMERVLSVFATPLTPSAFAGAFERLCDSLRVPLHLVYRGAEADREHVERDVRAWVRLMEIVRETMAAAAEERPAGEPLPLRQHTEMVRLALLRERYNVREEFGRGVLVTSIDETRGLPVEVMFVAGLVDGEFPSVYQTEVFLSVRRQRIREQRHNWRNRYLFYQAVTNWSDRLYLTYPDSDGDVDFVRSPFVDAFLAAVEADEWNGGAGTPLEATLWSPDDALRWFASRRTAGSGIPASLQNRLEKVRFAAAVERSRAGFHDRPGYEGILGSALSERCLHVLRERRDEVYSISELETYQACPFRYMAEHLLRLFVPEDFREDLSAVERGSLLHEALRRFFTDRRTRGMPPLAGCSEETFEAALHDLKSVLEEELAVHTIPDPFWEVDRQILLGEESGTGGIARAFLEAERSRLVETTPAYFEAAFGGARGPGADDLLSTEEPLRLGGVLLRGRIDRVETGDGFYAVMDYKTGRELPGRADLEAGLSLQLPVYLGAAGELLGERGGHPAAALYCQLRDQARFVVALADRRYGGRAFLTREGTRRPVLEEPEFRGLIDSAYRTLGRAVEGIASARFPLTEPHLVKRVCTFCPYSLMCRIQSSRKVTPTEPEEQ